MNKKRPHQVTFRLSDEELEQLKSNIVKSGLRQQEYLRRAALSVQIMNTDELKEVWPELKRQGNNLNQIAKQLNSRQYVDFKNSLEPALKEWKEVWQLLRQYLHTHQ